MVYIPSEQIWMVVAGFIVAFVLAFGIGANDVANSFGTSVGSKVLTLKQACILASIFETLGAVLLGAKVSDTIRKGIIDVEPYRNHTELMMVGNVAALSGSCIWMFCATLLRLPVSATHSIVGATVGFALVAHGVRGIHWSKLGLIMGSWFISPVLSGIVSTALFYICKIFILSKDDPLEPGLRFLPIFYAFTVVINFFSIFYDGPELFMFHRIPLWGTFIISFGSGTICAIMVRLVLVPWQRRRIKAAVQRGLKAESAAAPTVVAANKGDQISSFVLDKSEVSKDKMIMESKEDPTITYPAKKGKENLNTANAIPLIENYVSANCKDGANNYSGTNEANNAAVGNGQPAKALMDISNYKVAENNGVKPKQVGPKINKAENAPLMDNEYNLGQTTPMKSPTCEDLSKSVISPEQTVTDCSPICEQSAPVTPPSGKRLLVDRASSSPSTDAEAQSEVGRSEVEDRPETTKLFSFLQILTAIFGAFAHGGNDVSNAIGPLISLWLIATTGKVSAKTLTPVWILFYGGVGISVGLWIWGRRVIKTIGEDLTKITPSSGFCIEVGSALTVLIASNVGIPISTTHCKIGSIVFVGHFRSRKNVDWSIFRNIILAWLVTLPFAGGLSAALMALLNLSVER